MKKHSLLLPRVCCMGLCLSLATWVRGLPQSETKKSEDACKLHEFLAAPVNADTASQRFYARLDLIMRDSAAASSQLICLRTDVTELLSEKEERQYKALPTNQARAAFLKRFWLSQDPTPATLTNERLVEHYERLLYAREHLSYPGSLGYDDRGKIYIKYGPPDETVEDGINFNTLPFTTWAYYNLGAPVCFDFIDAGVNGFRFADQPTDALVVPGILSYIGALDNLLRRRASMHPDYARLLSDISDLEMTPEQKLKNPSGVRMLIDRRVREYANDTRLKQYRLPPSVSVAAKEYDQFASALRLAQFQTERGEPLLLAFYGFHSKDLRADTDSVQLRAVTALRDTSLAIAATRDTAFYVQTKGVVDPVIQVATYDMRAEKYDFLLQLENAAGMQRSLCDYSLIPGKSVNGKLHLSSIIFAEAVTSADSFSGASAFYRNGLAIVPHPFEEIESNKPVWLYFEAYSLARNREGKTNFTIEYEIDSSREKGFTALLNKLNPFSSGGEKISLSETRQGNLSNEALALQLDLAQLPQARYELIVRLTDHHAGLTKESTLAFSLRKN